MATNFPANWECIALFVCWTLGFQNKPGKSVGKGTLDWTEDFRVEHGGLSLTMQSETKHLVSFSLNFSADFCFFRKQDIWWHWNDLAENLIDFARFDQSFGVGLPSTARARTTWWLLLRYLVCYPFLWSNLSSSLWSCHTGRVERTTRVKIGREFDFRIEDPIRKSCWQLLNIISPEMCRFEFCFCKFLLSNAGFCHCQKKKWICPQREIFSEGVTPKKRPAQKMQITYPILFPFQILVLSIFTWQRKLSLKVSLFSFFSPVLSVGQRAF